MTGPLRWKDQGSEADSALREVMRYAQQQGPDDAQLAALTERVRARLPSAAAPTAAAPLGWKAAALGLTLLLGGFASWLALAGRSNDSRPPAAPEAPSHAASAHGEQVVADAVAAHPEAVGPEVAEPTSPEPRRVLRRRPARAQPDEEHPAVRPEPARAELADDSNELRLLHSARRLSRSDLAGALAALREHERRYPEGAFCEEREALWVELLWRAGQQAEGRVRLEAFTQRYPNSAYRARIRRWLPAGERSQSAPVESAPR